MDYSEQLHEFIDGTLPVEQESELFYALAADSELRKEMNHFMNMEKSVIQDYAAFTPSSAATAGVFSSLGISAAIPVAKAAFWSGATKMLAGIAGSALVTALVFLAFMKYGNSSTENIAIDNIDSKVEIANIICALPNSINDKMKDNIALNEAPKEIIRYVEVPVYIERENPNIANTKNEEYIEPEVSQAKRKEYKAISPSSIFASNDIYSDSFSNEEFLNSNTNSELQNEMQNTFVPQNIEVSPIDLGGTNPIYDRFALEIRGAEYFNMQKATVDRSSQPRFEDVSFGLMYNFNDRFALGIETRQEFFYQDFSGFNDGSNWNYTQYTNYLSGNINARFKLFELYGVRSIGQIGLGFAKPGAIGRTFLGFEYNPFGNIGLVLGLEGSVLAYHHKNNYFYSPKLGLHYGIQIKL